MADKSEIALTKIRKLYEDKKSHGFVLHLIHAYMPVYKAHKIFEDGKYRCCILGDNLMTVNDQLEIATGLDMKTFIQGMINEDAREKTRQEIVAKRGNREVGLLGENTDKPLSIPAFEALQNFVSNEILCGNREINGLVRTMMRNSL